MQISLKNPSIKAKVRLGITIVVLSVTAAAFVYYLSHHRSLLSQLKHTPLSVVIEILALYAGWFVSMALILQASLMICRKKVGLRDTVLLNAYSSLVNFFIPGQGGIAVRAVYLKRLNGLKVRKFIFSNLVYYAFYAVVAGFLLLVCSRPWWQTILGLTGITLVSSGVLLLYCNRTKSKLTDFDLSPQTLSYLLLATIFQALIQTAIYGVELHQVNHAINLTQMMSYTGAASFSLFVALTPGAIGIRESFLVFSQRLHHISDPNIVSANVIDRGVFLVALGIIFLITIIFQAHFKTIKQSADSDAE